jgi:hypothetical protein
VAEITNYIYTVGPLGWAVLAGFGSLVVTLSPQHVRLARGFFLLSALPLFAVPITFGCTASSAAIGLPIATVSAFLLAMIYSVGISVLNEHLKHADKTPKKRSS